jgi:hypothetical protein
MEKLNVEEEVEDFVDLNKKLKLAQLNFSLTKSLELSMNKIISI